MTLTAYIETLTEEKYERMLQILAALSGYSSTTPPEVDKYHLDRYRDGIKELATSLTSNEKYQDKIPNKQGILLDSKQVAQLLLNCLSDLSILQPNFGFELERLREDAYRHAEQYLETIDSLPLRKLINYNHRHLYSHSREQLLDVILHRTIIYLYYKHYDVIKNSITAETSKQGYIDTPAVLQLKIITAIKAVFKTDLKISSQRTLYYALEKTSKPIKPRFLAAMIAINAFMGFVSVVLQETSSCSKITLTPTISPVNTTLHQSAYNKTFKHGDFFIAELFFMYILAALVYADLFSRIVAMIFKQKIDFLSVTLISVVGAIIARPWIRFDNDIISKLIKNSIVFVLITGIHAAKSATSLYKKLFTKKRWWMDGSEPYQRGPTAPARIFMAVALIPIHDAIINIFKISGYDITENRYTLFGSWSIPAVITQLGIIAFYLKVLPQYAAKTDAAQGLPRFNPKQLFGIDENKSWKNRQAENIWITFFITFLTIFFTNLINIFTNLIAKLIISIFAAIFTLFGGTKLGATFQHFAFTKMTVIESVDQEYLRFLCANSLRLGYSTATQYKINELLADSIKHNKPPEDTYLRSQKSDNTFQNGKSRMSLGMLNLIHAIAFISLFALCRYLLFTRWITDELNKNEYTKSDTPVYLFVDLLLSLFVTFLIRVSQHFINKVEPLENFFIESIGLPSRILNIIIGLVLSIYHCDFGIFKEYLCKNIFLQNQQKRTNNSNNTSITMPPSLAPREYTIVHMQAPQAPILRQAPRAINPYVDHRIISTIQPGYPWSP